MPLELRGLHRSLMIVKPSIAFNDFSGTAKDVTARNVKGRNILSSRAQHSKIVTPAQAVSRNRLSKISRTFRQLSDSQINQWEVLAGHLKGISTFGQAASLTAHNAFVRINSNRAMVGMPPLEEAPVYMADVPEVLYDDLWISPDMIVFTGLEVPSDTYRLVVKMSPAQSPGTSSGWSKTVIVAPGIVDDWGEANITKLFTETIGVAPQAGMKYYLECWWLDTETGFTGESMWISAICKEGSTAYNEAYVPRARFTQDDVTEESYGEGLDFELSPGSAICSVDAILYGENNVACSTFFLAKEPKNFIEGKTMILARGTAENNYTPQTYCVDVMKWIGEYEISFKHRGGHYEKPSEVHTTGVFVDR